jgi:hypothetical protein
MSLLLRGLLREHVVVTNGVVFIVLLYELRFQFWHASLYHVWARSYHTLFSHDEVKTEGSTEQDYFVRIPV